VIFARGHSPICIACRVSENTPEISDCEAMMWRRRRAPPSGSAPNRAPVCRTDCRRLRDRQGSARLAEIIEHQRRQHQAEPGAADRARADMAHVGV